MKLFTDAHLFDGFGQGTKTYLAGLYSRLLIKRPDIQYYMGSLRMETVRKELGSHPNLNVLQYKSGNKFYRLTVDIPRMIKACKTDAAHFQYVSPLVKTCDEIVTVHDILFLDFPQYFPLSYRVSKGYLFGRSVRRADWVLTVSDYSKDALVRHYNLSPEKVIVTPNGVLDSFYSQSLQKGSSRIPATPYILYVSRFEPRKNQAGLLKMYLKLKLWSRGIKLIFIGVIGVDSHEFTSLYNSLPVSIKEHVIIYQDVSVEELTDFYLKTLLFVYPSFAEGFGIPPLEAAICGANVICSNATAMKEFDFFGNRLFDPSDEDEFADKIVHYIDHPAPESEKSSLRSAIEKKYNWTNSAENFINGVLNHYSS